MSFNPDEHLSAVRKGGPLNYLEVKWRLYWFREKFPHGTIKTTMLHLDMEKMVAIFKAEVNDGESGHAEAHGSESAKDFVDFIEKAETKAVGRALAMLGYGTQFSPELEEKTRIVDSPVEGQQQRPQTRSEGQQPVQSSRPSNVTPLPQKTPQAASPSLSDELNRLYNMAKRAGQVKSAADFEAYVHAVTGKLVTEQTRESVKVLEKHVLEASTQPVG